MVGGRTDRQMDDQAVLTFSTTPPPFKVTVDSQPVRPPVSRYGFRIEDTGHMYVIRTPSHILIQWLHSSGLMILEASKASEAQGRGLCGEVGPSWGQGLLPGSTPAPQTPVPLYQGSLGQCQARVGIRRAARQRDPTSLMSSILELKLPAGRWLGALASASCRFRQDCLSASLVAH